MSLNLDHADFLDSCRKNAPRLRSRRVVLMVFALLLIAAALGTGILPTPIRGY